MWIKASGKMMELEINLEPVLELDLTPEPILEFEFPAEPELELDLLREYRDVGQRQGGCSRRDCN